MTVFITGTDTDVGKTIVTACLAHTCQASGLSVAVYKPVQTGSPPNQQAEDLQAINRLLAYPVDVFNTYCFEPPVTPAIADRANTIDLTIIKQTYKDLCQQYDVVLVEGAGGVHVPVSMTPPLEIIDLIELLECPSIVVARPNLGTINHTRLTVNALLNRKIKVNGVVVCGFNADSSHLAEQTLPKVFDRFLPVPILTYLPKLDLTQPLPLLPALETLIKNLT